GKLFLGPVIEGEGRLINFLLGRFARRIPIVGILDKKHVQTRRVKKGKKIIQILYHLAVAMKIKDKPFRLRDRKIGDQINSAARGSLDLPRLTEMSFLGRTIRAGKKEIHCFFISQRSPAKKRKASGNQCPLFFSFWKSNPTCWNPLNRIISYCFY